jgi:DNA-directed RNA polymerase delta subunit
MIRKVWTVREWYSYGKWNASIRRTLWITAETRKQAIEKMLARDDILNKRTCKITANWPEMMEVDEV